MLTREENDLITQSGRGTPLGELMRLYWIPAALLRNPRISMGLGVSDEVVEQLIRPA